MVETAQIVQSLSPASSKALIINEAGPIGSHLVDLLLSLGCHIYYVGDKKKDYLEHLLNKDNFFLVNKPGRSGDLASLSYVFYLASGKGRYLTEAVKMAKESKAKLLLALNCSFSEAEKLSSEIQPQGIDYRFCVFDEIYGPRLEENLFSRIIKAALSGARIKIPGDGSIEKGIIFSTDFVQGLTKAMFAPETSEKVLDLRGTRISYLNFLSEAEKIARKGLAIDFSQDGKSDFKKWEERKEVFDFGWKPEVNLTEGIAKTISWWERKEMDRNYERRNLPLPGVSLFSKTTGKVIFGSCLFFILVSLFFLIPVFLFSYQIPRVEKNLLETKKAWDQGSLGQTRESFDKAASSFKKASFIYEGASPFYDLIGLGDIVLEIEPLMEGGKKFFEAGDSFLKAVDLLSKDFLVVAKGEKGLFKEKTGEVNQYLEKAFLNISLAWVTLTQNGEESSLGQLLKVGKYLKTGQETVVGFRQGITRLKMLTPLLSELTGEKGRRVYLILLQNNLELRPTGGFIEGYGLLTFEEGQIIDSEFKKATLAEEGFRGQVKPPSPIIEYLGQTEWRFREANWEPDFLLSAERVEWFFERGVGRKVDGVIAIDLEALKGILEVIGEVELSAEEKINAQNLLEKAGYRLKEDVEGEAFLSDVTKAIFNRVKEGNFSVINLSRSLFNSLEEKDILLSLHNYELGELFRVFNWDGGIKSDLICQNLGDNCFADYLYLNEANLGVNRSNYFLRRAINRSVDLTEEGSIKETLKITYQNLSLAESWTSGKYKAYLRMILPPKASFTSLMLNDPVDPNVWVEVSLANLDIATQSGKQILGYLVEVPIKSQKALELKYEFPRIVDVKRPFNYLSLNQKQSGFGETPLSFTFSAPTFLKPIRILPSGVFVEGKVLINDFIDRDKIYRIDFTP